MNSQTRKPPLNRKSLHFNVSLLTKKMLLLQKNTTQCWITGSTTLQTFPGARCTPMLNPFHMTKLLLVPF